MDLVSSSERPLTVAGGLLLAGAHIANMRSGSGLSCERRGKEAVRG